MFEFFKKIHFNRFWAWYIMSIAFLLALVISFILNIYFLSKTKENLGTFGETSDFFKPKKVNVSLMEKTLIEMENRRAVFEDGLLKAPEVNDPSI